MTTQTTEGRNVHLTSIGGGLRARGMTENEIRTELLRKNCGFSAPLPENEVYDIARSVSKYPPGNGNHDQAPADDWREIPIDGIAFDLPPGLTAPDHQYRYGSMVVCRWNAKGDKEKTFKQFTLCRNISTSAAQWLPRGPAAKEKPLYHLDLLRGKPDAIVVLVEGEKSADAFNSLQIPGYIATTFMGGSSNAKHADYASLKGRSVILWPDNDTVGTKAMTDALPLIRASGAASCKVLDISELTPYDHPTGWDVADFVNGGAKNADVLWFIEEHSPQSFFGNAEAWDCSRFVDEPQPIPMLIENVFPADIVGLFFAAGGVGKSTMALDLAVRIAFANVHQVYHFGHKINGGTVAILTAEDSDLILNHRLVPIIRAIAKEYNLEFDYARDTVNRFLKIRSTVGNSVQLYRIDETSQLSPTEHYTDFCDYLKTLAKLRLVIVDTKSRFSPGEGGGNVLATQEIAYYEAICSQTGASVLLLHHTNKISRNGSQTGQQAYRDATALFDSVRFAWYLRPLNEAELIAQGVPQDQASDYLLLENAKNNYHRIVDTIILRREGWTFNQVDRKPPGLKKGKVARERTEFIGTVSKKEDWSYSDLTKMLMSDFGKSERTAKRWISECITIGMLSKNDSGTYSAIKTASNETDSW